jgi:hypothetical protein
VLDAVLRRWRRRRARAYLELGKQLRFEFDTPTAGRVELQVIFSAEGDRLDVNIVSLYAKSFLEGGPARADVGLPEMFKGRDFICGLATDAGYDTVRFRGRRVKSEGQREAPWHSVVVDLRRRAGRP